MVVREQPDSSDALEALGAAGATDRVEEHQTHAAVQAALFGRVLQPIALGRYVLLEQLGAGGGGTVYQAYDSELHRRVAVKVVGAGGFAAQERERLLREARVVASLSHPNIVAIHDVGAVPRSVAPALGGPGIYMVMELVDGVDLGAWCRQSPRGWSETLEVLVAAGRGIEAAHRAGVVHRDIKPHNVRVGDDGRVKVLDFGLAAGLPEAPADASEELELERSDGRSGTPAYMAPEQHQGELAQSQTDQYGFCVMAWEALFGARPFAGKRLRDLEAAKREGPPPQPAGDAPLWLGSALGRGLEPDPQARFSSMGHLLELIDRPRRSSRLWPSIAFVATVGAVAMALTLRAERTDGVCEDIEARLDESWGAQAEARAREAFVEVGAPYGENAWATVKGGFDGWAKAWVEEYRSVCATDVAPEVLAARTLCLSGQLTHVGSASRLVERADETVVRHASAIADGLPTPADCRRDPQGEHDANPAFEEPDPRRRSQLLDLQAEMQQAKLLRRAGKEQEAFTVAHDVETQAQALGESRMLAEAKLLRCRVGRSQGSSTESEELCYEALEAAEQSGSSRLPVEALLRLAESVGQPDERAQADGLFRAAWARLQAAPESVRTPALMAWYLTARGNYDASAGRLEDGRALLRQGLARLEEAHNPESTVMLPTVLGLASVTARIGHMNEAERYFQRAARITRASYGEQHPRTAIVINNYGNFLLSAGRYEASVEMLEHALDIKRAVMGEGSPMLATTHLVLARANNRLEQWPEALAHADETLRLHDAFFPDAQQRRALAVAVRSDALRGQGRCQESLPELMALERQSIARQGRPRFDPSDISLAIGRCLTALGDAENARQAFARGLVAQEAFWGPGDRHLVETLTALGTVEHLRRAQQIIAQTEGNPAHDQMVADALVALGGDDGRR